MSLSGEILGPPGRDNALLVRIDTGTAIHRLLFDCGEGCLDGLAPAEVARVEHLFVSHFHMDHVGGFDRFFRLTFDRADPPVWVWGPEQTVAIMHHRFLGYVWNLMEGQPGAWIVSEVGDRLVTRARFLAGESFAVAHPEGKRPVADGRLLDLQSYSVDAVILDHGTPSLGYVVREKPRRNVDAEGLAELALEPGPWLQAVKDMALPDHHRLEVEGRMLSLGELRKRLIRTSPGQSIAYVTDFVYSPATCERLASTLAGCDTLVCESQYLDEHRELAGRYLHLTVTDAARIASAAGVGRLILLHVSERYREHDLPRFLDEARAVFPATFLPPSWTAG